MKTETWALILRINDWWREDGWFIVAALVLLGIALFWS